MDNMGGWQAANSQLGGITQVVRSLNQENAELQHQLTTTMHALTLMQLKYEQVKMALIHGWSMRLDGDEIVIDK